MKYWHFYDKVYRVWVQFMICSQEELLDELKDQGYKHIDEIEEHLPTKGLHVRITPHECDTGSNYTIIWLPKYETAALSHEIVHLAMRTFDDKGVPLANENTEALAYYVEFWFNEITRKRKKYPDGSKSRDVKN